MRFVESVVVTVATALLCGFALGFWAVYKISNMTPEQLERLLDLYEIGEHP